MYTIFRSFILNIHGGCCLFSHITIKTNKKIKKKANTSSAFNPCWSSASTIYQNNLAKERSEKKCGAHTHVHQLSRFSSQYSRRLLSILAQPNTNNTQKNKRGLLCKLLLFCVLHLQQLSLTNIAIAIKKMQSTHACTPSFATSLTNIHVGCYLFSHNLNNNIKTRAQEILTKFMHHSFFNNATTFV